MSYFHDMPSNASPEAKELAKLAGHEGDPAPHIQANQELLKGLGEYQKWRDRVHNSIGGAKSTQSTGHGLKNLPKKLA